MIIALVLIGIALVFALGYSWAQSSHPQPIKDPKVKGILGILAFLSLVSLWQQRKR